MTNEQARAWQDKISAELEASARGLRNARAAFVILGQLHLASSAYLAHLHVRELYCRLTGVPMLEDDSTDQAILAGMERREMMVREAH